MCGFRCLPDGVGGRRRRTEEVTHEMNIRTWIGITPTNNLGRDSRTVVVLNAQLSRGVMLPVCLLNVETAQAMPTLLSE